MNPVWEATALVPTDRLVGILVHPSFAANRTGPVIPKAALQTALRARVGRPLVVFPVRVPRHEAGVGLLHAMLCAHNGSRDLGGEPVVEVDCDEVQLRAAVLADVSRCAAHAIPNSLPAEAGPPCDLVARVETGPAPRSIGMRARKPLPSRTRLRMESVTQLVNEPLNCHSE